MLIGTNITASNAAGYALRAIISLEMFVVLLAIVVRVTTRVTVPAKRPAEAEVE